MKKIVNQLLDNLDKQVLDFNEESISCLICGSQIYPEPENYCDHIYFVYALDFEGLLVYQSNSTDLGEMPGEVDVEVLKMLCNRIGIRLGIYESQNPGFYGHPTLFVGSSGGCL